MVSSTTATPMSSRADRLDDEDTSSVSDYDSEWTQVSGTEDEGEGESDFQPISLHGDRPLSRTGSSASVDGEVWEGFADDAQSHPGDVTIEPIAMVDVDDESHQSDAVAATEDDLQINSVLNSSLVGTLRSVRARSAAGSLQSSLTESQSKLRLSFPDPLVRPEEEVIQSSSPVASVNGEQFESCSTDGDSSSFADIGAPSTLIVSETHDEVIDEDPLSRLLSIVLYGSAASSKWRIAELVAKAIVQREPQSFLEKNGHRVYFYDELEDLTPIKPTHIQVIDRTTSGKLQDIFEEISGPSLAVIILPASVPNDLPSHTLYLPLLNREPLTFESGLAPRHVAEDSAKYTLRSLEIPEDELVVFYPMGHDTILDIGELGSVDARTAAKAFSRFALRKKQQKDADVVTLFANGWQLMAFVAVTFLAVGIGFVILSYNASLARQPLKNVHTWNLSGPETRATTLEATVPGSSKENTAVAVHQTALHAVANVASSSKTPFKTPAADVPPASNSPVAMKPFDGEGTEGCACHTKQSSSWSAGLKETKDLLVRAIPAVPMKMPEALVPMVIPKSPKSLMVPETKASPPTGKEKEESSPGTGAIRGGSGVSTQVQEFFDLAVNVGKALLEVVSNDLRTLFDACDELLIAVARQVDAIREEAKRTQARFKDEIVSRNKRASKNAKMLKEKGKRWLQREVLEPAKVVVERTIEGAKQVHGDAVKSREKRRKVKDSKQEHVSKKQAAKEKKKRRKGEKGKDRVKKEKSGGVKAA